jgi:hypothetical protein
MRRYIFTERERRLLEEWMEAGEETGETRKVLSWIRKGFHGLAEDVDLMLRVIRVMQRRRRWRGRITSRNEFGSALRRAESALSRVRRR